MSKRSNQKRINTQTRVLKFLRQQAKLSIRKAARASGVGEGVINHLETGRIQIHSRHLEKLLPAYKVPMQTYEMFASGTVALPQDIRSECLEIVRGMSMDQLRTALPVLNSLHNHK